ncbi:hypothetical protein EsDP_00003271 [Epichloe bromicola]|uniref:U3 small nucleolar RNA-associated protein 22 n=1 Tax=Epichloe bromicola TaxID=79588 RepID=A0ABQ0CNA5_9HYPO
MESGTKRRKIEHGGAGLRHDNLIDFESRSTTQVSTASTFVLQTDELLKEAKLDYTKSLKDVDNQLHRIKTIVDSIAPHEPLPIAQATSKFEKQHRIIVPYPDPKPTKESPYKIAYSKPSQCNVVGSHVLKTMTKSQSAVGVDMVAQMPSTLFQEKDYLDLRYFYRRAYFIAYIAAHVRKEMGDVVASSFEFLNENPLLPVLVLRPLASADTNCGSTEDTKRKPANKDAKKQSYYIRLIPCAPDDLFPWSKLTASANCTRLGNPDEKKGSSSASPFYNSTINGEMTFIKYLRVLAHAKNECSAFSDACILGRVWLQQRGFGGSISQGGFGHFEWSIMMALLLQMGGRNGQAALPNSLSSTELFKAGIQFLSTTSFTKRPFAFSAPNIDHKAIWESGPVMFDPIRHLNILYKMSTSSAHLLQIYAKSTSDLLADEKADKFQPTFIMKTDVTFHVFDAVVEIKMADLSKYEQSADRSSAVWKFSLEAHRVLKKAFGNRAQLVHMQQRSTEPWPLSKPSSNPSTRLLVAVIFDPANMPRQMDYGPPAEEEKEAAAFRHFWGQKAELRRFKDGSILECVEWSGKMPFQICQEIAVYSLKRHLNVAKEEITAHGSGFSSLMGLSHLDKEAFDTARRAFTTFENDIRSLEDLPLQIRQLSPVSPLARYSSLDPPLLGYHKDTIDPMDVNLYFEASSKWPENLTAIQEAKVEFLLDFDRRLRSANDTLTTQLGRENRAVGTENLAYLDIVYESGAAFRLRIYCDLEETLLQRQAENKAMDAHVREEAVETLAAFKWQYSTLPLHTQTIATFCTRLPPLSHTIRLVKQWFCSHKLRGHISDELVELFVLHVFLQPYPWKMPSSPSSGFLRTLLFLSRWDWREEPLIVDSAETITSEERTTMRRELESWRKRDPHMNNFIMFVATSSDLSGQGYTRNGPSKLIASRMTRLAKAACNVVRKQDLHLDPAVLFESSLQDYDVLIHLSTKVVKTILREAAASCESSAKRHSSQYKNLDDRTGKIPLPTRTHPTTVLLQELQRVYSDSLIFFVGRPDDSVVAAIWNPKLQPKQKFRVGLPYNFCKIAAGKDGADEDGDGDDATTSDVVEVNREAILLEIARAGGDMIRRIEISDD